MAGRVGCVRPVLRGAAVPWLPQALHASLRMQALAEAVYAVAYLGRRPPDAMLGTLHSWALGGCSALSPRETCNLAWAFAAFGPLPAAVWDGLVHHLQGQLERAGKPCCSRMRAHRLLALLCTLAQPWRSQSQMGLGCGSLGEQPTASHA